MLIYSVMAIQETPTSGYGSGLVGRVFLSCPPKCEPVWQSGPAVFLVSSFASGIILMSLPDPNAAAPAPQPAEVIATTDEIEKKRIELKSMLSGCIASGKLQKREKRGEREKEKKMSEEGGICEKASAKK